ncbi:MAG: response regulator [Gammaproteobacteria bacterium]|nr:response regulator [Gammaproteobacteria bacterium]MDH5346163.1 response regulator [Gammaproteobacteria bacterium]
MNKTVHILLVEDDLIDAKAFLRAIEKLRISNPVTVARDGLEAWQILKGIDGKPPLPRPYLLVLDINMPRMNGLELLERIRDDADLHDAIVFMLTTSNDEEDKIEAFHLNVAGYMLKSDVGNSFIKAVELMNNYWRLVEFPPQAGQRSESTVEDRRGYVRHPDARGVL